MDEACARTRLVGRRTVDAEAVAETVNCMTGIPLAHLRRSDAEWLSRIEKTLCKRVVGQDEAIAAVGRSLRRSAAGLRDFRRPIGSFMFVGPTGVGKTLLAKALAEFLFGTEDAIIQMDMSEYSDKFNASRLIGAPPGYVGYEEGSKLIEHIRHHPYCVVLFDEIEKAHPDIHGLLLQLLEDGHLTDSYGRRADFRNAIIIMTTNVGCDTRFTIGFRRTSIDYDQLKQAALDSLKKQLRPELLNRIDEIVVFKRLSNDDFLRVVDLELARLRNQLADTGVKLVVSAKAKKLIASTAYSQEYGARPIRRAVDRLCGQVAEFLLCNEGCKIIKVVANGNKLAVR